jgi:hypothetical protein
VKLALLLAALLPAAVPALALEDATSTTFTFRVRKSTATVQVLMDAQPIAQRLVISFSDPHLPQQVIQCDDDHHPIELLPAENNPGFVSADYDGDGYNDFSFEDATGTSVNVIAHYFFYSPTQRRFVRRSDFDESGVSSYDARTGLFSYYWRGGPSAGSAFYRMQHGRLTLVRRLDKDYSQHFRDILPHVPEFREYLITTLYLPGGRVRRFYRYIGPD